LSIWRVPLLASKLPPDTIVHAFTTALDDPMLNPAFLA